MAIDTSYGMTYFLSVEEDHKDYLGAIRHWSNLKIAFEDGLIWIKDLTSVQMDSLEIKTIPLKNLYYSSGPKLFSMGSLLPSRNIPSLLWTPIERGLPVRLSSLNHNFFGIKETVSIRVTASTIEEEAYCLMVNITTLGTYLEKAPAIRLKNLSWVIVDDDMAFITGIPMLPLQGNVYWRRDDFLLPVGLDLELPALSSTIHTMLNGNGDYWVIWNSDGSYGKIPKQDFKPLSLYSFRSGLRRMYERE